MTLSEKLFLLLAVFFVVTSVAGIAVNTYLTNGWMIAGWFLNATIWTFNMCEAVVAPEYRRRHETVMALFNRDLP